MKYDILEAEHDPMGAAIYDYQHTGKAAQLRVMSSMFEDDEMPVDHLFRSFKQMPRLEQKALEMARAACSTSELGLVVMPWRCKSVAYR